MDKQTEEILDYVEKKCGDLNTKHIRIVYAVIEWFKKIR